MLSKEVKEKIAKYLQIDFSALDTAITSEEETTVEIPELVTHKKADYEGFKKTLIDNSRTGIIEVAIRDFKKEKGFTFEGKTFESLGDHLKEVAEKEAGAEPEKKYKTLETKYKSLKDSSDTTINGLKKDVETAKTSLFINTTKMKSISSIRGKTKIPLDDIYHLCTIKKAVPVKLEGGVIGAKNVITGETLMDDRLDPIPFDNVFKTFVDADYLSKGPDFEEEEDVKKDKDGVTLFKSYDKWERHYKGKEDTPEARKSLQKSQKLEGFTA